MLIHVHTITIFINGPALKSPSDEDYNVFNSLHASPVQKLLQCTESGPSTPRKVAINGATIHRHREERHEHHAMYVRFVEDSNVEMQFKSFTLFKHSIYVQFTRHHLEPRQALLQ